MSCRPGRSCSRARPRSCCATRNSSAPTWGDNYCSLVRVGLLGERVIRAKDQRGVRAFSRLLLRCQLRTWRGVEHVDRRVSAATGAHGCHRGGIALLVSHPELEVVILEELDVHD